MSAYVEGFKAGGNTINLRWGDFLTLVLAKHLAMQYTTGTDSYTIWAVDGNDTYVVNPLVFAASSSKYPFPMPDGYTATQNNTDVATFTGTYQSGANTVALSSVGATGAAIPLSADLIGIDVAGNLQPVSSSNPLPVTGTFNNSSVSATGSAVPSDATYIAGISTAGNLIAPAVTLASTAAIATEPALVVALSPNSPLPAGSNALGSVSVTGSVAVTGTFYQATQPVSGTVTVDQGTLPWIVAGGGTAGSPGTAVLTVQGIAGGTAIPVTGTFNNSSVSATGSAVPSDATYIGGLDPSGNLNAPGLAPASTAATSTQPALVVALSPNTPVTVTSSLLADRTASGNIALLNDNVAISTQGVGTVGINITGTWSDTLTFEGTIDGTNWFVISAIPVQFIIGNVYPPVYSTTTNGQFVAAVAGLAQFRVIATAYTSGTAVVTLEGNQASNVTTSTVIQGLTASGASNWLTMDAADGPVSNGTVASRAILGALRYLASPPTLTGGNQNALLGDVNGNLLVNIAASSGTVAVTQSTSPWITKDQADGSATGGTAGSFSLLAGAIYNSTPPTLTNGQQAGLQSDSSGNLKVNLETALPAGSNVIGAVTQSGSWTTAVSGTVAVTQSTSPWIVAGGGTAGSPGTAVLTVQGIAGGTPMPVSVTSAAAATYRAATFSLLPAATPTDFITIQGSATKTVTITRISFSGTASAPTNALLRAIIRSAADTAGTSTTLTNVPLDSNDAAATAVVKAYTANPTALGAAVGDIEDVQTFIPDGTGSPAPTVLSFGSGSGQMAVLRGTSQFLCLNLNGVTITGGALNVSIEWTEA